MFSPDTIIKEYRVTEKAADLTAHTNKYTFEVSTTANRREVASAVEKIFDVKVVRVNIINQRPKTKRNRMAKGRPGHTAAVKKAIVTLDEGQSIELV
ncbi:50S ribosomal protein L23 [Cerasicoccus arenae]|uniref:Large ribosomal subunit protein uL23 n=1 Tax=Cerasicoccus arenae TaxID=424488 RepID=A0A8J3DHS2_9BACT|nr:50S ribosomal protein L23 [Cerasicoccus arenae]MBK1857331.1 50S ribosomal protein L23 [Cerasicoccus arenae]GHC08803.1 50S ribosomal protein L23 [Cerasicoccus arenae]